MKYLLSILLIFNLVAAQTGDFVNSIVVPEIVLFILAFGILSFIKLPKLIALLISLGVAALAYISGIILTISSVVLSLGGLASTGIYILGFLVGAMLISRQQVKPKKMGFLDVRRMSRKQISQEMSSLEKKIVELQARLEKIKIQEHNLELQFAATKSSQVSKELDRIRRVKNELSDALDALIERREVCKRAYRQAV
ncbi:MAG: hypothetical protein N3E38_00520 [Candidatus Aenigmarchaeota archaeon]|nr:hypothetical protein [Candidatus Aenigmarchaeota archaeon]MCX8179211.1 hypothetical protein [Candidatus Aenigmarchaeota archaeon]